MIKDIEIMIELQQFWDIILTSRDEIERSKKSIIFWQDEMKTKKKDMDQLKNDIKVLKNDIKKNELELSDIENKIIKLEERRNIIKTEKELNALNHELETLQSEKDKLEEQILELMDDLDNNEKSENELTQDIENSEKQFEIDKQKLEEKISLNENKIVTNQNEFDDLLVNLSVGVKSKFTKLIKSKDGKAIANLNGETCGFCNCQVPASLAIDASKGEKISNCTNCGKYIY